MRTRVADGALDDAARSSHRVHAKLQIVNLVQRVKDAEDVDAAFHRLLRKRAHDVVGVGGVAHLQSACGMLYKYALHVAE